jgi:LPS-assembly protein
LALAHAGLAQEAPATQLPPQEDLTTITTKSRPLPPRTSLGRNVWHTQAISEETEGHVKHLHGHAEVEDASMLVRADDLNADEETGDITASGNVYFHDFDKNEQIWCDHLEYNSKTGNGKFYVPIGETMPRVVVRRGILSGNSPFHFEGAWAERIARGDEQPQYFLHNGWVTNCLMPNPWWTLRGPKFDIIPEDRALAYKSTFLLRKMPVLWFPFFYHSLKKEPRKSGFLIPSIVPRSQRGFMIGLGYYWAINRSYDLAYRLQDYNTNAFGHHVELRGSPKQGTAFDLIVYGVQDVGGAPGSNPPVTYSGASVYFNGKSDLGNGWYSNAQINYVSSFRFRQEWSGGYGDAINSQAISVGFVNKDFSTYTFDFAASRTENFQNTEIPFTEPNGSIKYLSDAVLIYKLPEADFSSRDRQVWKDIPLWFSFDSSGSLLSRSEPDFNSSNVLVDLFHTGFNPRFDFAPRVTSAFHFAGINFVPSVGIDETYYGESQTIDSLGFEHALNSSLVRSAQEFSLDIILPSLARIFEKKTIFGDKLKHVIEPRVTYRYVTGVGSQFDQIVRYDENDLLTNTNELTLSLTNRIYAKRGNDVQEIFTWELMQKRYFNPTFGGAVVPGQLNVFEWTADLSGMAFLLGPRTYSPIDSLLRASPIPGLSLQWQTDYDPLYRRLVNSSIFANYHWKKYFVTVGNNAVNANPLLSAPANQVQFGGGFGDPNKRGWNAAVSGVYDINAGLFRWATTQVTYNTDCCGFSVEYRRINAGLRDETSLTVAFAIANIGTFGTLKKQDRLF